MITFSTRPNRERTGAAGALIPVTLFTLFLFVLQFLFSSLLLSEEARTPQLVLISIDGLYPDIYRKAQELKISVPNLESLAKEGASADGMIGIFPSTTYPSHATMITGVRSYLHGITANTSLGEGLTRGNWYWFPDSLRVPTLPEVAHKKGLEVAVSSWPCLCGAAYIDLSLPEIWSVEKGVTSRELVLHYDTPGLVEKTEALYGPWTEQRFDWGYQDDRIVDGACALIELEKPDLLLVHFVEVDHVLHAYGRDSKEALKAFEIADSQLGRILDALKKAGIRENTNIVVVGDHGFANIHSELRPNVELRKLGLLEGSEPRIERVPSTQAPRGFFRPNAAAGAVYFSAESDTATPDRALAHFRTLSQIQYKEMFHVLDRKELQRYGAFPGASFGLACEPGYTFSSDKSGEFLSPTDSRGTHGFLPENPLMYSGFIASGPSFKRGTTISLMRMVDVAPTLARVLGVTLGSQVEGKAREEILR